MSAYGLPDNLFDTGYEIYPDTEPLPESRASSNVTV